MASVGASNAPSGKIVTFEAASDLSSYQYRAVQVNSSGRVSYGTGGSGVNTLPTVGVLQNKPAGTARAAEIMVNGVSKIYVEAAVTIGNTITFGTAGGGSALPSTGTVAALGICTKSADTAGDIGEVLILPHLWVKPT